ncbi:MAG: STAS domain-containing protein [Fibrobacter sp.]|jgi:anti-anti-sigma regulatory factor|nr:STAS domain-containing protein [Fibrobacter sp.]
MNSQCPFREIGLFHVFSAPQTPIGTLNAEGFKEEVRNLLAQGKKFIAVDLNAFDFLYSDAYNAFISPLKEFEALGGVFGLLTSSSSVADNLSKLLVNPAIAIFENDDAILSGSNKLIAMTQALAPEEPAAEETPKTATPVEKPAEPKTERAQKIEVAEETPPITPEILLTDDDSPRSKLPWVILIALIAAATVGFLLIR